MTSRSRIQALSRGALAVLAAMLLSAPALAAPEPDQRMIDWRFGSNGRMVIPFDEGGNWRDDGYAAVEQADGKVVVAGVVELGGGRTAIGLMRLTRAGNLDIPFGGAGNGRHVVDLGASNSTGAYAAAVQDDGKIVVAGWITGPAHQGENFLVMRFNANGTLDTGFGLSGRTAIAFDLGGSRNDWATGLAIQDDGKIVVAGNVQRGGADDRDIGIVRLNPSGGADAGFGDSGKLVVVIDRGGGNDAQATSVAIQRDGKIAVAGWVTTDSNGMDAMALRVLANGASDTGFGINGVVTFHMGTRQCLDEQAMAIKAVSWNQIIPVVASQRRLILAGTTCWDTANGNDDWDGLLVRLNDDGSLDTSFNGMGYLQAGFDLGGPNRDVITGIATVTLGEGLLSGLFPPNRIVVSGTAYDTRPPGDRGNQMAVRMLTWNGAPDPAFGQFGKGYIDFDLGSGNFDWSNGMILTGGHEAVLVGTTERDTPGDMDFAATRIILDRIFAGRQEND